MKPFLYTPYEAIKMASQQPDNVCEQSVFKQVFDTYANSLRNFIYYKCGDKNLSEDLLQDAFLRLWKNCAKVPFSKAKSYLFTVANNLFLDGVKHQKVVLKFRQHKKGQQETENPQFLLESKEFKERLESAIGQLPENSRIVFLMNRMDKLTYREIAERLGLSVKAVEKRMHKALVELRKLTKKI